MTAEREHELTFRVRYRAADWDPAVGGADVLAAIPAVLGDDVGNQAAVLVDAELLPSPAPVGETGDDGDSMAQALVDIFECVDGFEQEIRPDYDELVQAAAAVRGLVRAALPPGTLEGWAEEAHGG